MTDLILALLPMGPPGSGSGSGDLWYLLLLGPVAGIAFYTSVYLRYRNTNKRFEYERKTSSDIAGLQGFDQKVDQIRGTSRSRIQGGNADNPRQRLGNGTTVREQH